MICPLTPAEAADLPEDRVISHGGKLYDVCTLLTCGCCDFSSPFETDFGPDQDRCWDCEQVEEDEVVDLLDLGHPLSDDAEWEGC